MPQHPEKLQHDGSAVARSLILAYFFCKETPLNKCAFYQVFVLIASLLRIVMSVGLTFSCFVVGSHFDAEGGQQAVDFGGVERALAVKEAGEALHVDMGIRGQ